MSKAVKSVSNLVTGKVFGGSGNDGPGMAGTGRFKASTRKIDKKAFEIAGSEDAAHMARKREGEAAGRSKEASINRKNLITDLQKQAAGEGPSLAEAQLKSASERNLAQQLAAAQSQRGGNVALQQRELMRGQAAAGRETAQDSAQARIQEQQVARQQLGDQISQEQQLADQMTQNYLSQGFNIEQARQQAQADYEKIQTDQYLAAQGANLSGFQSAANNRSEMFGGVMQGIGSVMTSDERAKKKIKKATQKDLKLAFNKEMSKDEIKDHNKAQALKGIKIAKRRRSDEKEKKDNDSLHKKSDTGARKTGKAIGQGAASAMKAIFSDKEVKINKREVQSSELQHTDVPQPPAKKEKKGMDMSQLAALAKPAMAAMSDEDSKKDMKAYNDKGIKKDFLDKLKAYTYEYKDEFKKDPRAGEGRHMSVMAQDLEKAGPIGKSMVQENENGVKEVNYAKGYGAILAAQAHLNKRLNELEKKKSKK